MAMDHVWLWSTSGPRCLLSFCTTYRRFLESVQSYGPWLHACLRDESWRFLLHICSFLLLQVAEIKPPFRFLLKSVDVLVIVGTMAMILLSPCILIIIIIIITKETMKTFFIFSLKCRRQKIIQRIWELPQPASLIQDLGLLLMRWEIRTSPAMRRLIGMRMSIAGEFPLILPHNENDNKHAFMAQAHD